MEVKQVNQIQASLQTNSLTSNLLNQTKNAKSTGKEQAISQEELFRKTVEKSPELLQKLVEELKNKLSMLNTQLQIQIDKDTKQTVIKVIDKNTKEVIRQIPPEYLLKIAKYIDEITGLLLRKEA